jgi:hypothetical protein
MELALCVATVLVARALKWYASPPAPSAGPRSKRYSI